MSDADNVLAYVVALDRYENLVARLQRLQQQMEWVASALLTPGRRPFRPDNASGDSLAPRVSQWPPAQDVIDLKQQHADAHAEVERLWQLIPVTLQARLQRPPQMLAPR